MPNDKRLQMQKPNKLQAARPFQVIEDFTGLSVNIPEGMSESQQLATDEQLQLIVRLTYIELPR